ncbi:MAG TPA: alanine racemase [Streptosporangiaceae bacterium]|nr:alanine racemase [Streptosporangiaceae bacterium]
MTYPVPPLLEERLRALRERPIEPVEKGFGSLAAGGTLSAAALAAARPPLHAAGFTYPLLTLRETALRHNIAAMAGYCARAGVALAPHGKTAMSPELAARQLRHGAWGITVATIGQMQTYRAFGFPRLLLANELVDRAGIAWLAAELAADPGFEAYCYVDSLDGVQILDRALERHRFKGPGRPLPVLVELGHDGGRTGCRTDEQALAVAKAANAAGTLTVAGVAGFEGTIGGDTQAQTIGRVASFCRRLRGMAAALAEAGPAQAGPAGPIVTAGGSAYFDVVTRELAGGHAGHLDHVGGTAAWQVVLRSGAYLTYDHGFYGTVSPGGRGAPGAPALRPALELWAQVLSRPEPGLALLGAGRRDAGFDKGLPVPVRVLRSDGGRETSVAGWRITELNDQHAYLRVDPGAALAPGDLVALGISHPCTTLDKWRVLVVVSDQEEVTDAVHAFF